MLKSSSSWLSLTPCRPIPGSPPSISNANLISYDRQSGTLITHLNKPNNGKWTEKYCVHNWYRLCKVLDYMTVTVILLCCSVYFLFCVILCIVCVCVCVCVVCVCVVCVWCVCVCVWCVCVWCVCV